MPPSFGGGRYLSEELLTRAGEKLLAWLDVDDLSRITVSDLNHERPFVVKRQDPLPAFGASPEALRAAMNLQRAPGARANAVFKILDGGVTAFRPIVADADSARRAREFRRQNAEFEKQQKIEAEGARALEKARRDLVAKAPTMEQLDAMEAALRARGSLIDGGADFERRRRGTELISQALSDGATKGHA